MNPPLRSGHDRKALVEALAAGDIDCIATDHAPHAPQEKETPSRRRPSGHRPGDGLLGALYGARRERSAAGEAGRADERGPGTHPGLHAPSIKDGEEPTWHSSTRQQSRPSSFRRAVAQLTLAGPGAHGQSPADRGGWSRGLGRTCLARPSSSSRTAPPSPARRSPARVRRRRDRLQHRHDRLSGGGHRSLLLRPAGDVHVPADRQLRGRRGPRRVRQGARPRHHRARDDQLPLQPRVPADLARLARGAGRAGRHRRRHARPHPSHPRARARCGRSSPPTSPTPSTCASRRRDCRPWLASTSPRRSPATGATRRRRRRGPSARPHVVAYDFGIKRSMLGCSPAAASASPSCRRRRAPRRCSS